MSKEPMMTVPMEFGLQEDGSIRMVVHIADVMALPQILRDIGNHVPEIIEVLSNLMQEFIEEEKGKHRV